MSPVANPGMPDGPQFLDPMRGYGQPPLPTAALNTYAVIGGDMTGSAAFSCVQPGNGHVKSTYRPILPWEDLPTLPPAIISGGPTYRIKLRR